MEQLGFFIVNDDWYNPRDATKNRTDDSKTVADIVKKMEDEFEKKADWCVGDETVVEIEARLGNYTFCIKCQDDSVIREESPKIMCLHAFRQGS